MTLEIIGYINAGILPLNQLFPNLHRLKLKMMYSTHDYSVLDCEFPHLELIGFEFDDRAWQRKDQIEAFLRKNSQVKTVEIAFIPGRFLKELPALLPNIENMTLNIVCTGDDVIQFDSVKHLKLFNHIIYMYGKTENILFPNLESLELTYSYHERNVYNVFFEKHSNLKKLYLKFTSDTLAAEVASKFSHLVEIKLDHGEKFHVEKIREIIESHKELKKIELSSYKYEKEQLEIYRQQFEGEWKIRHFRNSRYSDVVLFEKI